MVLGNPDSPYRDPECMGLLFDNQGFGFRAQAAAPVETVVRLAAMELAVLLAIPCCRC